MTIIPPQEKRCGTCAHWSRGTWETFAPDAKAWDGRQHINAGQRLWVAISRWDVHDQDQAIGRCRVANDKISAAVCESEGIYGELITDISFGCSKYATMAGPDQQEEEFLYP